ncbi:polyprenyl synthetase family protein [Solitalea sp. MAHUQ-68]|uniref:Polyprenyl synthetase family protein n=1 Tax=Solitalea agri TaxID=2953739 RepID=A0A9X2F315_9SPHI|nr:polyprenyl synthetase family protein [Solitalea agri]MCO4293792.1 polyprenyl synthetase family protein [Solitalea agri]
MYSIKQLQEIVNKQVEELVLPETPIELYEPIKYLMAIGGKRMRPVLTLMGCNLFTDNIEAAKSPALGLEVFHNFTLMHDDIMDNAPIRRGKETVHEKWNSNVAILSGDVMLVKAYELMMQTPDAFLRPVLNIFNKTAAEVCEGQQIDMNFEQLKTVSVDEYLNMIALKTAVLLGACLQTGALLGNASNEDAEHLYQLGKNLGIAFQLQDDILDVYGEPEKFGKQVGGDIIANKKTFLLIKTLELADSETLISLERWLNTDVFISEQKVKAVTDIYNQLNVKALAEAQMQQYVNLALNHLNEVRTGQERKQPLIDFANQLLVREQ